MASYRQQCVMVFPEILATKCVHGRNYTAANPTNIWRSSTILTACFCRIEYTFLSTALNSCAIFTDIRWGPFKKFPQLLYVITLYYVHIKPNLSSTIMLKICVQCQQGNSGSRQEAPFRHPTRVGA